MDNARRVADGMVVAQLTVRGTIIWRSAHAEHEVGPGTLMIFAHGDPIYYGQPKPLAEPYGCRWIGLQGSGLAQHMQSFVKRFGAMHAIGIEHPLIDLMDRIIVSATSERIVEETVIAADIHRFIMSLYDYGEQRLRQQLAPVDQAIESILQRPYQPRSLKEIAHAHGVSREHLSRRFVEVAGRLAKDVLAEARVRHGVMLLEQTRLTLSEVARQAGYANYHSFARQIKQFTKKAPSAYRSGGCSADQAVSGTK
ncbi:MAG: AraC family transcriptional regulator [Phycisphaerales bacterium]